MEHRVSRSLDEMEKPKRPLVVAEIGINHNGNVGVAKSIIALAKNFGADFVKFQKRTVDVVYTEEQLAKPRASQWGDTTRDQKLGIEFERAQYDEIDEYCRVIGMRWFATPMDVGSLDFLMTYDLPFTKIASADLTHLELLRAARKAGRPVILSTGMSTKAQIDAAVDILGDSLEYLLHCVGTYPTIEDDVNMLRIDSLRHLYGDRCKIGFSCHAERIIYNVQAYIMGVELLEFHVTIDRDMAGSDQKSSIGPVGVDRIMSHLASIERGWGDGSIEPRESEKDAMEKLRRYR